LFCFSAWVLRQTYIWSFFFRSILNVSKIKEVIDHTKLDPLLPEDMITPLEQQFLTSEKV